MKHLCSIFLFFLCSFFAQAQTKHISIPISAKGDTTLWYKWHQSDMRRAKLADLSNATESLHFRFSTEIQSVDIIKDATGTFHGTLASFTTGRDERLYNTKKQRPAKFYSTQAKIDTATARQVYNLFQQLSIFNIPTDDSISAVGFPGRMALNTL